MNNLPIHIQCSPCIDQTVACVGCSPPTIVSQNPVSNTACNCYSQCYINQLESGNCEIVVCHKSPEHNRYHLFGPSISLHGFTFFFKQFWSTSGQAYWSHLCETWFLLLLRRCYSSDLVYGHTLKSNTTFYNSAPLQGQSIIHCGSRNYLSHT